MGGVGSLAGEGEEDELEPEGEERLNGGLLSPGLSRREDIMVSSCSCAQMEVRKSTVLVQGQPGFAGLFDLVPVIERLTTRARVI